MEKVRQRTTLGKPDPIKVEMVLPEGSVATRTYDQVITKVNALGKEIKISPKACVTVNKAGFKTEFYVPTISINIGIGKDHTADLIMDIEAWEALTHGAVVHITTVKEFEEKYIGKRKRKVGTPIASVKKSQ